MIYVNKYAVYPTQYMHMMFCALSCYGYFLGIYSYWCFRAIPIPISAWLSLQWRHNECNAVSNYQLHDCLLNHLFRRISKKTSKLGVDGLCVGNSPATDEFPPQRASNAENVSTWCRHHVLSSANVVTWMVWAKSVSTTPEQNTTMLKPWV